MIRIILFVIVIGIVLYLIKLVVSSTGKKVCKNCNGEGYWRGTRGERNPCKPCNGSGKNIN